MSDEKALPEILPIFPLPDVVVFPQVSLPLHIFEPRYRALIADLRAGGGNVLGMCLLRPGWEGDYEGRPPVFSIGCAGRLERCEQRRDGRYDIVLRGLTRFRVLEEVGGRAYRLARVQALPDAPADPGLVEAQRKHALAAIARGSDGPRSLVLQEPVPHDVFVNALAQGLPLSGLERQSLLDCDGITDRYSRLLEIMEFRQLEGPRDPGRKPTVH